MRQIKLHREFCFVYYIGNNVIYQKTHTRKKRRSIRQNKD